MGVMCSSGSASAPDDEEGAALERMCGRGAKTLRSGFDAAEADKGAKLAVRLPCSIHEQMLVAHAVFGPHAMAPRDIGDDRGDLTWETDRALEVGTCRDLAARGAPGDYVADSTCPNQPWLRKKRRRRR